MSVLVSCGWRRAHPNPDVAEVLVYNNSGRLPPPPSVPLPFPPVFEKCGHSDVWSIGGCQDPTCFRRHRLEIAAASALLALPCLIVIVAVVAALLAGPR